jgi:hypothetical protein
MPQRWRRLDDIVTLGAELTRISPVMTGRPPGDHLRVPVRTEAEQREHDLAARRRWTAARRVRRQQAADA